MTVQEHLLLLSHTLVLTMQILSFMVILNCNPKSTNCI